ncbi:MAG: diguanylate cyclase domain-containing protein [Pseudomarimonas sp.]
MNSPEMNSARDAPVLPRVLVVDDEPINIRVLAEALSAHFDVRCTTRGEDTLRLAAEFAVDLILLDLQMPLLDGYAVLATLKEDPICRDIPVIIVTAMSELADEEAGLAAGAVDYITKPISPAIVRARVRTHVELKQQRDRLANLVGSDGLTGIANRRRFDEQLELRWRLAQRNGGGLTLMLADVDHFKQYNDHYGHGAGDECLRRIATALQRALGRSDDLVARYGGEEFAILTSSDNGTAAIFRLLTAVRNLRLPHAKSSTGDFVSISLGAFDVRPHPSLDSATVMEQVDGLLYQAKRGGRARARYHRLDHALPVDVFCQGES